MRAARLKLLLFILMLPVSLVPWPNMNGQNELSDLSSEAVSPPKQSSDAKYDFVIRGARVVDGTGNPWFVGDVAVQGDRIAAIGSVPPGAGKREIDAKGLVLAPGFIDMHSHSDWVLLEDGHAQGKIRQGVTTEVLGEGSSAGPWKSKLAPRRVEVRGKSATIVSLADYFRAVEESGISVNVLSYVGIGNVWEAVMGQSHARPTSEQIDEMKSLVAEAMQDGAFGLSSQVMMPPGSLAAT